MIDTTQTSHLENSPVAPAWSKVNTQVIICGKISSCAAVLGSWQICHGVCLSLIALLATIGIVIQGMPLLFLNTWQWPLWILAAVFFGLLMYLRFGLRMRSFSDQTIVGNAGLLLAGVPFGGAAQSSMRTAGLVIVLLALLWYLGKLILRMEQHALVVDIVTHGRSILVGFGGILLIGFLLWIPTQGLTGMNVGMNTLSRMKLTVWDVAYAKELMDKDGDGKCDTCGMDVNQCIAGGQLECTMGQTASIGVLGSQHIHADFKVYINSQALDFSDKDHMGRVRKNLPVSSFMHVDSGSPAPEKTGDILHMHATGVPLGLFFKSIGMKLEKDSFILDNGWVLKNENGNTLKFYLNGKKADSLENYVFQDLDKILISYGQENDPDIERQLGTMTNFAVNH